MFYYFPEFEHESIFDSVPETDNFNFFNIDMTLFHNDSFYFCHDDKKIENSQNPNFLKEKDIKFSLYPLYINWKQIESTKENNYYQIYNKFGYFGVAIFSRIKKYRNDISYINLITNLVNLYYSYHTDELENKTELLKDFMNYFPDIDEICSLIKNKIILYREIAIFLLVMKIYEMFFYKNKKYKELINVLKYEFMLCGYLSNEEYKEIYSNNFKIRAQITFDKISREKGEMYNLQKYKKNYLKNIKRIYRIINKESSNEDEDKGKEIEKEVEIKKE